jgi:GT2 family glycosyltransferase
LIPAAAPKVFVCILNWNKRDDTLRCIDAVLAQDYPNLRTVVIDNASTDDSLSALRALGDRIDLIEHAENLGYTGGCNAGMRHALANGGDYVWLLNNDSDCEPDTLSRLVAYAEARPDVGMVTPIIVNRRTGKDCFAVGRFDLVTGLGEETAGVAEAEAMQEQYPRNVLLKGTALLVKRALIEKIGFLDDRFFAYMEDSDYCVRCAVAGFRAACVTTARIYHDEGLPDGGWRKPYAYYYMMRNGILFWHKHASGLASWKCLRWYACTVFRMIARSGYGRAETEAFADGLWSGLRGITGRWEPSRPSHRMPSPLRRLFAAKPALTFALMEANPKGVLRAISSRSG